MTHADIINTGVIDKDAPAGKLRLGEKDNPTG
jgi:hypothetical protein